MALVEHLKGMSLTASAQRELKSLLKALVMLGKEEIAQQIQCVGENFQLTQLAAVKLAEDTMTNETVDENAHTLEHYIKKLRASHHSQALCWQSKVLLSPLQVKIFKITHCFIFLFFIKSMHLIDVCSQGHRNIRG